MFWGGVWLASCPWRHSAGWVRECQSTDVVELFCRICIFVNWSTSLFQNVTRAQTAINYEALRYCLMTTTCFVQELLQSRTFVFPDSFFPLYTKSDKPPMTLVSTFSTCCPKVLVRSIATEGRCVLGTLLRTTCSVSKCGCLREYHTARLKRRSDYAFA